MCHDSACASTANEMHLSLQRGEFQVLTSRFSISSRKLDVLVLGDVHLHLANENYLSFGN
jgi:hypothetical protein